MTEIHAMVAHGFIMRLPAPRGGGKFAPDAADSMVGTFTEVNAREFGIEETWRMEIVAAEVVDDGDAIKVTLQPPRSSDAV